jgi:hypothetical protein
MLLSLVVYAPDEPFVRYTLHLRVCCMTRNGQGITVVRRAGGASIDDVGWFHEDSRQQFMPWIVLLFQLKPSTLFPHVHTYSDCL